MSDLLGSFSILTKREEQNGINGFLFAAFLSIVIVVEPF